MSPELSERGRKALALLASDDPVSVQQALEFVDLAELDDVRAVVLGGLLLERGPVRHARADILPARFEGTRLVTDFVAQATEEMRPLRMRAALTYLGHALSEIHARAPDIEELVLGPSAGGALPLSSLASLRHLRRLVVAHEGALSGLASLPLRELTLLGTHPEPVALPRTLRHLTVGAAPASPVEVKQLALHRDAPTLDWLDAAPATRILRLAAPRPRLAQALARAATLPDLSALRLDDPIVSLEALLPARDRLEVLRLTTTWHLDVSHLASFSALRYLELRRPPGRFGDVPLVGVEQLARAPQLGTLVTDWMLDADVHGRLARAGIQLERVPSDDANASGPAPMW